MRATQLTHFGTDQSPMMTGQSSKIRTRWNSATKVKTIPVTTRYVFRSMSDHIKFPHAESASTRVVGFERRYHPL
jgi:hypothetical protein